MRRATIGGLAVAASALALGVSPAGAGGPAAGPPAPHGAPAKAKPDHGAKPKPPHGAAPAAHQAGSAHGIVQSVSARAVLVRELDGSIVSVPVEPSTHVFVDGRRASLADVGPGFVAAASWTTDRPAGELEAFDPSATFAVVQSVTAHSLVVTDASGKTVTVRVAPRTRVLVDGKPSALRAVVAGYTLVVGATGRGGKPPSELRFLSPG